MWNIRTILDVGKIAMQLRKYKVDIQKQNKIRKGIWSKINLQYTAMENKNKGAMALPLCLAKNQMHFEKKHKNTFYDKLEEIEKEEYTNTNIMST